MSRFLYWSIYGGTFLLSVVLVAASVMAVFGYVPFHSPQQALASPSGGNSFAASRIEHDDATAAARRDDPGGWDAVWQARSGPAGAGGERPGRYDRFDDNVSMPLNGSRVAAHAESNDAAVPGAAPTRAGRSSAAVVAELRGADRTTPDASISSAVIPPVVVPDGPPGDQSSNGAPLIIAGMWPGAPPNRQSDPPADEPDDGEPGDDDQGDAGGGDGGDTNGDPLDQDTPKEPLRLSLVPGHDEVAAGEIVSVQVVLSAADRISSVPFHVRFNSEVLEYVGAKKGPAIVNSPVQPILLAAVNPARPDDLAVGLALVRSSGRFSGSGTVVVLDFRALQAGQSDLLLEKASVRDTNSRPLTVQIENSALSVR